MSFFYDLNKRLADITAKTEAPTINESVAVEASTGDYSAKKARAGQDIGKPGKQFAKIARSAGERYGSKERGEKVAGAVLAKLRAKESVEEADMDESALQAYLGKKKYGEAGMKALQQAGRDGASKEKMAAIRAKHDKMDEADMDEGNKFAHNVLKAKAAGLKKADLDGDGDMEQVREKKEKTLWPGTPEYEKKFPKDMKTGEKKRSSTGGEIEKTATGVKHTARYDDEEETKADDGAPKKRGRPKGSKHSLGAKFTGKSKLLKKGAIKEMDDDTDIAAVDQGEYDREGDMAREQLHTVMDAAKELHSILDADENLPEWVQSKITKALDYLDTARDYVKASDAENGEQQPVAEKAVSKAQRAAAGIAYAAKKGDISKGELRGASKEMAKMDTKELKKFAKTKEKGLPEKVKAKKDESVEETKDEAPKAAKGGFQFGKGIYDSINREVENLIAESMNISMNMSNDANGGPSKSLTVTATDEDAMKLGQLLKMAGIGGSEEACPACGKAPCGCEQMDEAYGDTEPTETKADWPTNTETSDDALQYSGGLNKPKTTVAGDGQTTVPVTAVQVKEESDEEMEEDDAMGRTGDDITMGESLARLRDLAGIQEAAKPDYIDLDKDGDKKESMKKAAQDKEEDKKVEESILSMTNLWKAYKG